MNLPVTGRGKADFWPFALVLQHCLVPWGWAWVALGGGGRWLLVPAPPPSCRLLVGAPQALALPGQQANRTGGLFACPLSLEETDCYRVDIDRGGEGSVGLGWGDM